LIGEQDPLSYCLIFGFHQQHSPPYTIVRPFPGLLYALEVHISLACAWTGFLFGLFELLAVGVNLKQENCKTY
jgi:hypothetical protein